MDFGAEVFFRFDDGGVFRLYRLLDEAAADGARIDVTWVGIAADVVPPGTLQGDGLFTAMAELLRTDYPQYHEAFVQAVLSLVHIQGVDISHPGLMARALAVAEVDLEAISATATDETLHARLADSTKRADQLGVKGVPTLYRNGPVLLVRTTGAVRHGSATQRLETIAAMLDDDGLWELSKP